MHIPFNKLKDDARIWIFQANRILANDEVALFEKQLKNFTAQWAAHGKQLNSSFTIVNNAHIIVGVDISVNEASGCSIDALVHQIQELGHQLHVDFFDRKAVAFKSEEGVSIIPFEEVKPAIEKNILSQETLVYNNLISSKEELATKWQVKAENSWLKRFFKSPVTT
jgi:phosphatidate phosphatase PAH1